jgi:hypothetical protein
MNANSVKTEHYGSSHILTKVLIRPTPLFLQWIHFVVLFKSITNRDSQKWSIKQSKSTKGETK